MKHIGHVILFTVQGAVYCVGVFIGLFWAAYNCGVDDGTEYMDDMIGYCVDDDDEATGA